MISCQSACFVDFLQFSWMLGLFRSNIFLMRSFMHNFVTPVSEQSEVIPKWSLTMPLEGLSFAISLSSCLLMALSMNWSTAFLSLQEIAESSMCHKTANAFHWSFCWLQNVTWICLTWNLTAPNPFSISRKTAKMKPSFHTMTSNSLSKTQTLHFLLSNEVHVCQNQSPPTQQPNFLFLSWCLFHDVTLIFHCCFEHWCCECLPLWLPFVLWHQQLLTMQLNPLSMCD